MKRAILSIRSRLILEAVTLALKRAGIAVEKTSSQSAPEILLACEAAKAHLLVMDVTRDGEGTFDLRMQTVKSVKAQNPDIKVALLCDKVSGKIRQSAKPRHQGRSSVRQGVRRGNRGQSQVRQGRGGDRRILL